MEINMSKGLVNLTFAYPSILTVSIYDGCLGIAAATACWVEQQRLGKEAKQFLDCMHAWAAWVCGARTGWSFMWRLPALSHSFLLPFFLFLSLHVKFKPAKVNSSRGLTSHIPTPSVLKYMILLTFFLHLTIFFLQIFMQIAKSSS